jgi:putative oxidoreductase
MRTDTPANTLTRPLSRDATRSRSANIFLWAGQIVAAGMFLMAGGSKLAGAAPMVAMFAQIGIGQWFRYLTGTIEVISAVLLLIPSLAFFGAVALASTMVGAIFTHLFIIGGNPAVPIVLLAITAAVAWARRPSF